jgi:hypothetical protein
MIKIGIVIAVVVVALLAWGAAAFFFGGPNEGQYDREIIVAFETHIWISPNGTSSVAGMIVQNGGLNVVNVEKITIEKSTGRWQPVPMASWYYNDSKAIATTANILKGLKYDGTLDAIDVTGDGISEQFSQAKGPITLGSGYAMFLCLANPANIQGESVGQTFKVKIQTAETMTIESVPVAHS